MSLATMIALALTTAASSLAQAQDAGVAARRFHVSHSGADVATCGALANPCRTIVYALEHANGGNPLEPGDTLYLRGGTEPDTNSACSSDGAQGGACWVQPRLSWDGPLPAGAPDRPLTVACYPGETCILEGTSQDDRYAGTTVHFENTAGGDASRCSHVVLEDLILDGRRAAPPAPDAREARPNNVFSAENASGDDSLAGTMTKWCHDVTVRRGKIRHGYKVACATTWSYRFTFEDVEVYECGYYGGFDHGYYLMGLENKVVGGRIHHNSHGVQIQWKSAPYAGNARFERIEIDHNGGTGDGGNAFWGNAPLDRPDRGKPGGTSDLPAIILWPANGAGGTITGCNVHHNSSNVTAWYTGYGIGIGLNDLTVVPNVTITNNHVWSNQNQWDYKRRCGEGIYISSSADVPTLTCSGNVAAPP